jgi:hypothetical protein
MSKGFEGDMGTTVEHIAAISKSVKDTQTLEVLVEEHRGLAKEGRHIYLTYTNKDDQRKVENLEAKVQDHLARLTTLDPEILDVQSEQQSIRDAQANISLLQDRVRKRTEELVNTGWHKQDDENLHGRDWDDTLGVTQRDTAPPSLHNTKSSTVRGKKIGKAPKMKSNTGSKTGRRAIDAMSGQPVKSNEDIQSMLLILHLHLHCVPVLTFMCSRKGRCQSTQEVRKRW